MLDLTRRDDNLRVMPLAIILCCLLGALSIGAAQDAITPTNRIELLNGRDFSGWTFCMKNDADPGQSWSITNGLIHCTGRPTGYLRTQQSYRNYALTVEWRFVKIAPKADNTGILVHIQPPDQVWPMCVQVQGRSGHQGDLFLMEGAESKEHRGMDKNSPLPLHGSPNENPIGEWNTNLTVCADNDVKVFTNGKLLNETSECTVSSGCIGIQSEGAEIEIRKIFLEPLKSNSPASHDSGT